MRGIRRYLEKRVPEKIVEILQSRKFQKIFTIYTVLFLLFSLFLYIFSVYYGINVTKSAPLGIYRIYKYDKNYELKKGDLIIYSLPEKYQRLSILKGTKIPTMKEIVAFPNDNIEIKDGLIYVNGENFGEIIENKKLPKFNGILKKDEVLTLSKEKFTFDGRYYGGVKRNQIKGIGKLVYEFKN